MLVRLVLSAVRGSLCLVRQLVYTHVGIKVLRRDELVGSLVGHSQSRAYVAQAHALLHQQPSGLSYLSRSTGLSLARLLTQLLSLLEVRSDLVR